MNIEPPTTSDQNDRPRKRRRIVPRIVRQEQGGDSFITTIEEGKGVAVGKYFVQIGTLAVPVWPLVLLLLVVAATIAVVAVRSLGPARMTGAFNVAVAEFGQIDQSGNVQSSDDAARLSQAIFQQLTTELNSLSDTVNVLVWHDSLDLTKKRTRLGVVQGRTAEERMQAARQLAERIGANVVIYGNLATNESPVKFLPEFYFAEHGKGEMDELVGPHEFGKPVPVSLPFDVAGAPGALPATMKLASRGEALGWFVVGLALEYYGEYQPALEAFQRASQVRLWRDDEGKEIVYAFIGRENYLLERFDDAETAFQMAKALNADYPRAYLGLGNVRYKRAEQIYQDNLSQGLSSEQLAEVENLLIDATVHYLRAQELAPTMPGNKMQVKAHQAMAGAYRLLGDVSQSQGERELAQPYFDVAMEEYAASLSLIEESDHLSLALTYLGQGVTRHLRGHGLVAQGQDAASLAEFQGALEDYGRCIDQAESEPANAYLQELSEKYCQPYQRIVQEVLRERAAAMP